jgi:branched-chain amino acid transport system ATP-binding protein
MMLEVKGLSVTYGAVQALDDVSLTAPAGQVTAVIGANGAGKSTLMRTVAGLVRPASGEVRLDDALLTGRRPEDIVRSGVVLVPEGRSTIPELTVVENLDLGGLWRDAAARKASKSEAFDLFPILAERSRNRADTLSGGERQQLAIARALMCAPTCLLLDEPSLGLAPLIVTQILELVHRLAVETNLAVLLVEQNVAQALKLARYAYVLEHSEIAIEGAADELAGNDRVRKAYLGL